MDYKFENGEKSTVKIYITLDKSEWESAISAAYEKTKGKYSLQGFRKGHVPKSVIEKTYGKGVFFEDAINGCFYDYYKQIIDKEENFYPLDQPDIDVDKISEDGVTMIAVVPVKPEVKLGAYKGIKIKKVEYNVSVEDVNAEIEKLRERNSRMVNVSDRPAANGDTVVIDYSGSVDGVKFAGGTAEKQNLVLGSGSFIPGFEDQVVGMNIGDEKDVNVTFPEDYHAEELKGKAAVFAVKLHEIKFKELPEVNDEFIKDAVGAESVEEYRKETAEKLQAANDKRAERETDDNIIKAIAETTETEIPEVLVERNIDDIVQDVEYRLMYQGLKLEDYLKYIGTTMEDFRKNYREQAETNAKYQLVMNKIVEQENISCTDEELDAKIEEIAKQSNKTFEEYKAGMNPRQKEYVKDMVVTDNMFKFLRENNNIGS